MKRFVLCGLLAAAPFMSANAAGATAGPLYMFGSGIYDFSKTRTDGRDPKTGSNYEGQLSGNTKAARGLEFGLGYRISPNLATEVSFEGAWSGKVRLPAGADFKANRWGMRVGVLGIMPIADNFELFTKASIGYQRDRISYSGAKGESRNKNRFGAPALSVGATMKITQNLSIRGEFEHRFDRISQSEQRNGIRQTVQRSSSNTVKLGMQYAF